MFNTYTNLGYRFLLAKMIYVGEMGVLISVHYGYLPKLVIVEGPYRTKVLILGHIINIIVSQAIAHANLHPHDDNNGHVQFLP